LCPTEVTTSIPVTLWGAPPHTATKSSICGSLCAGSVTGPTGINRVRPERGDSVSSAWLQVGFPTARVEASRHAAGMARTGPRRRIRLLFLFRTLLVMLTERPRCAESINCDVWLAILPMSPPPPCLRSWVESSARPSRSGHHLARPARALCWPRRGPLP